MGIEAAVRDLTGKEVGKISLSEAVFGVPMNQAVVHQALTWQRANTRQGTRSTKSRGEVSGSTRKPWRQKHTGRARVGTVRSPLWRHGGIIFGPKPKEFNPRLPRKMRRLAIRCLLTNKREDGSLAVLQDLALSEARTKQIAGLLRALEMHDSVLLVTRDANPAVVRAARNIPKVRTSPASLLSAGDLLRYRYLIMTVDAVRRAEELWDHTGLSRKRVPVAAGVAEAGPAGAAATVEPEPAPPPVAERPAADAVAATEEPAPRPKAAPRRRTRKKTES